MQLVHRATSTTQAVGGLHEWPLPEGLPGLSWRSAGSSYAAFPSPVWQDGGGKVAQDVEGLERIQEASPREESAGLSYDGVGRCGFRAPSNGKAPDGIVPTRIPLELCSSLGAYQVAGAFPGMSLQDSLLHGHF